MDANLNEQSQGRHDRRFQAKHGRAQQWDVMKLYPYDHTSFFFPPMLLHLLTFGPTEGVISLSAIHKSGHICVMVFLY